MSAATVVVEDMPEEQTIRYYPDLEQGTDEWLAARCGIVTASTVGKLLTVSRWGALDYLCPDCGAECGMPCLSKAKKADGEPTPIKTMHPARVEWARDHADTSPLIVQPATGDDARNLTLSLVAERITGHVDQAYINTDMWRGILEEPAARQAYSEHHAPVEEMGFITRTINGHRIGYSPDGLVGKDGLIEIKSRLQKKQLHTILDQGVPAENMAQLQCGLLVTGRKWIDYVSFSGGMPLWVTRVLPDPNWFDAITQAVALFEANAADMITRYRSAVDGLPVMERIEDIPEMRVT